MLAIVSACSACLAVGLFIGVSFLFRPVDWEDGDRRIKGAQRLLFVASALAVLVALICLWGWLGELRELYNTEWGRTPQSDQPG